MKSEHVGVELGLEEWVGFENTIEGNGRELTLRAGSESGLFEGQGQDCFTGRQVLVCTGKLQSNKSISTWALASDCLSLHRGIST